MNSKKKLACVFAASALTIGLVGCSTGKKTGEVKEFNAEYVMKGTTSSGQPKQDTFIFAGKTEDGIITELNFDIIRNKGTDKEISKKDIMGYSMNVSDAEIVKEGEGYKLTKLTASGFNPVFDGGQFMVTASCDNLTDATTFKDLKVTTLKGEPLPKEQALGAYKYLANEAKIENFTEDTLVKDLIGANTHQLAKDGKFLEGKKRVSYAGMNGGRSYGEQMEAISKYILENKMTLEDVYKMFKTENQMSTKIEDRDTISGATISFVGDFQRMVYLAMHGELFEGVVTHTEEKGNKKVEVVTQGYGGEIETHVTFDNNGKIVAIKVRDSSETDGIGAVLTADNSDYIKALIAGQENVDGVEAVSGATVTSKALAKAVNFAIEYYKGL